MKVKYYAESDSVIIDTEKGGVVGSDLRDYRSIILSYADEECEIITSVEVFGVTKRCLPLAVEHGYDAESDTLTLGEKPVSDFRVVDSGEFVGYLEWAEVEEQWEMAAVDLRHASKHLKQVNETIIKKEKEKQASGKLRVIR